MNKKKEKLLHITKDGRIYSGRAGLLLVSVVADIRVVAGAVAAGTPTFRWKEISIIIIFSLCNITVCESLSIKNGIPLKSPFVPHMHLELPWSTTTECTGWHHTLCHTHTTNDLSLLHAFSLPVLGVLPSLSQTVGLLFQHNVIDIVLFYVSL